MSSIIPLGKNFVIKLIEAPKTSKGGLRLPHNENKTEQGKGVVVAVPRGKTDTEKYHYLLGKTVYFNKYSGIDIEHEDSKEKFKILEEKELVAWVEG